ncbi:MAG TPA: response regulator [Candidatus Acidoferrum sp.]|nr:response regulator [Candidatus Acidoferrum sp.]
MAQRLGNVRILVVEDEPIVALDLADFLASNGAVVLGPASSVAAARQIVAGSDIDCAVLDVNLGRESAAPLVRELSELKIPFVFMTGYDEKDMSPLWRNHPMLRKPMDPAELIDALTDICPSR